MGATTTLLGALGANWVYCGWGDGRVQIDRARESAAKAAHLTERLERDRAAERDDEWRSSAEERDEWWHTDWGVGGDW